MISIDELKARQAKDAQAKKEGETRKAIEAQAAANPPPNPIGEFAAAYFFTPAGRIRLDNRDIRLGRVDIVAKGSDAVLVLNIIDNSGGHGGSSYYSDIKIIGQDGGILAELTQLYLPVGGGKIALPITSFSV